MKSPKSLILYRAEQKLFDHYPKLEKYQRRDLFVTTKRLDRRLAKINSSNRPYFFVLYVYFKTHNKFYSNLSPKDLQRAAIVLGVKNPANNVSRASLKKYETQILNIFNFKRLTARNEDYFIFFIHSMIKKKKTNKDIFDFLIEEFARKSVVVPDYKTIEALIYKANDLFDPYEQVSKLKLSNIQKGIITEILVTKLEDDSKTRPNQVYKTSKLKRIEQSQKLKDIKVAVSLYRDLKRYYLNFEREIDLLELDGEGIKKTASEFRKMDISKVRRLPESKRNVLILAFISDQYYRYTDHFVEIIIDSIQKLQRKARVKYKEQITKNHSDKNKTFLELVDSASDDNQILIQVIKICSSKSLENDKKIEEILKLLKGKIRGRQERVNHYEQVKDNLKSEDSLYPELLLQHFTGIKNKLTPILNILEFEAKGRKGKSIIKALALKSSKNIIDHKQNSHLSETEKNRITSSKEVDKMYLVFLYLAISSGIKSGELNLIHSYKFRSLENYLIPKDEWDINKEEYLKRANLVPFSNINKTLTNLSAKLNDSFVETNQNIKASTNTHFNNKGNGKFTITTPATEYSTDNLLYEHFPREDFVPLSEILVTINNRTNFLNNLHHVKRNYLKKRPDHEVFVAGLIALGCNIGERKMAKISKSINPHTLKNTITWYFTKESLSSANDAIVNYLSQLSLPRILQHNKNTLHTSSDGSRWTVSRENILSRHSLKYFGLNKGININSHLDERHLSFYSKVISTSEREAASVLDGLLHNENIKSDIHSTDTHGYTEALFAIMSLLGFKFAPRIKSLKDQRLYSFKTPKDHKIDKDVIIPYRKLNTHLIEQHYDEILRISATIGTKYTEASQIFKRLNSYSNENPLYKALKEFGKINKTIFILEYLNDMSLRQKIEKQLNKIEASQKFSRAICIGNNQELIGEDFEDLEVGELSRRLIKNAIVCWNYLYLTKKIIREKDKAKRAMILSDISKSSILHWQHLNFLGEYDFSIKKTKDSAGLEGPALMKSNVVKMWDESQGYLQ